MKKIFRNMMALAIAAFAFTACEDVPEPYAVPTPAEEEEVTYTGDGTLDNPYTCTDAIKFAESLNGDESENEVYIKGKISEITEQFTTQYGNGTFKMSDDGLAANEFTAYRVLYLGNKKFANGNTQIQVGDEVIVCGKVVNYRGNTPETVQGSAYLYSLNGVSAGGGSTPTGTPTGTGTLADPFNAAAAIAYAQQVGDAESPNDVYIKGKVSSIADQFNTQYGNATFTISDDGTSATTEFTVYRALYLGNQKYTSGDQLNIGDEVIVCGKVTNYRGNTPETVQGKAYLYSLNGKTEGTGGGNTTPTGEAKGSGTQADPFNVQAIINYVSGLAADVDTKQDYYVKGIVSEIPSNGISTQYNNLTFYISDDATGSNKFYVFRAKGLNGGDVTENMFKVGDEVVIFCSTWVNYKGNTPETKQGEAYIVSIKEGEGGNNGGGNGGGGETSDGYVITMADFGLDNAADLTTLTANDGTVLTFAQEGGSNAPKYYSSGSAARMYALNSLTIKGSKAMKKVVLTCVMNGANPANGNDTMYGEAGGNKVTTTKDSDTQVTFSGFSNQTLKIVNDHTAASSGTQLRISKITITYE